MRVRVLLDELADELGMSDKEIANELRLDIRLIKKLRGDENDWRLPKSALIKLMLFAFEHGRPEGIFLIEPHPIWSTFSKSAVEIVRVHKTWDAKVESHLRQFFSHLSCTATTTLPDSECSEAEIADKMRWKNCVFIGTPKSNPASEIALALLWNAKPFDTSPKNKERIPVQFLGMDSNEQQSAFLKQDVRHGFTVRPSGAKTTQFFAVDWFPAEDYRQLKCKGSDGALLVICRRPLGTDRDVTTMVIAGYTGRATLHASEALTHGGPPIEEHDLEPGGSPVASAFQYQYAKRPSQGSRKLSGLRRMVKDSGEWIPRWPLKP